VAEGAVGLGIVNVAHVSVTHAILAGDLRGPPQGFWRRRRAIAQAVLMPLSGQAAARQPTAHVKVSQPVRESMGGVSLRSKRLAPMLSSCTDRDLEKFNRSDS